MPTRQGSQLFLQNDDPYYSSIKDLSYSYKMTTPATQA